METESLLALYAHGTKHSRATVDLYVLHIRRFAKWCDVEGVELVEASPLDCVRFFEFRLHEGLRVQSLQQVRSALRSFFTWAVEQGLRDENPVPPSSLRVPPPAPVATLSVDELRRLWHAAPSAVHALVISLLGLYGVRPEDALSVDVQDCELVDGRMTIRIDSARGPGRSPVVRLDSALTAPTLACIDDRQAGPLLRRKDGEKLDRRTALRWVRHTADLAQLDRTVTLMELSFSLRAIGIAEGFSYLGVIRAVGEIHPSKSHRWWRNAPHRPEQHAGTRLASLVFEDRKESEGKLAEANYCLDETHMHPAVPVMLAAATLENHLRDIASLRRVHIKRRLEDTSLVTWANDLRGQGLLSASQQASILAVAGHRSSAAHGWFDRIDPGLARHVVQECQRLLREVRRPVD